MDPEEPVQLITPRSCRKTVILALTVLALSWSSPFFFCSPAAGAYLTFVEVRKDGTGGVDGLGFACSVALSPDGRHVYAAGVDDSAVAVFSRNEITGKLTFVEVQKDGVGGVDGLSWARSVTVSADGRHVYATGRLDHAVAVFSRNEITGELTFVEVQKDGVGGVDGLQEAFTVTVSPDGRHVYATGGADHAVAVFSRSEITGKLTFVEVQKDGVNGVDGLGGAYFVAVSPDGRNVYVSSMVDDAVAVFSRNESTGKLTFVEVQKDGVGGVDGLNGAYFVTVSPDGRNVYAAGYWDDAVAVFRRDESTGKLTFVSFQKDGVGGVDGLAGAYSAAVSPDGRYVHVTGDVDDALAVFTRNENTGKLTFVAFQKDGVGGVDGLSGAESAAVSPDGRYVYVASNQDNAIAVFRTDPALASATHTVTVQKQGSGNGVVWSVPAGIACGDTCSAAFPSGVSVTLRASPDAGSAFDGWSGGTLCGNGDVSFTADADVMVTATFNPDTDGDGISDYVEDRGPNGGDADGNGTPDRMEKNVATFQNIYGAWITLVSETGTELQEVTAQACPSPDDVPAASFGQGFFSFEIHGLTPGAGTTARLIMPAGARTFFRNYYQYGPTPTNPLADWYAFVYEGETGAVLPEDSEDPIILLYFKDGALGDADLQADGTIVDPGGPVTERLDNSGGSSGCFVSGVK